MNNLIYALVCFDSECYFAWMLRKRRCTSFWTDWHANRPLFCLVSKNWSTPKYLRTVTIPIEPCRRVTKKGETPGLLRIRRQLKFLSGNIIDFIFIIRLKEVLSSGPRKSFLHMSLHIHLKKLSSVIRIILCRIESFYKFDLNQIQTIKRKVLYPIPNCYECSGIVSIDQNLDWFHPGCDYFDF